MSRKYAMMEEIKEQSTLLRKIFANRKELCKDFVALDQKHQFKKIIFVGNGSPYYAGCILKFAAEKLLKAESESIPAGVFRNHAEFNVSGEFLKSEILLVCPAESGHSKGQVDAARRAKKEGISVMSTTLNPKGILARTTDIVLAKPGKHEIAMASTKGQTMAIYMIFLNFLESAFARNLISDKEYQGYLNACERLPENVENIIKDTTEWFEKNKTFVMNAPQYFLIGYGANYGTVQEAGLKFFECHGKPTFPLELEESLHGPFRALHKEDVIFFLVAEDGAEKKRMLQLADALNEYCEHRIVIANQSDKQVWKNELKIHGSNIEFVNTIEYLTGLQTLSFLIANEMGIDLSKPLVASLDDKMHPAYED